MALDPVKSPPPSKARAIVQRTRGRTHGPATRLMSPSDLGEILKPFVFLDLFGHEGAPFNGGLHPISIYQAPKDVPEDGPARVPLGSYGSASSAIASPRRSTISRYA